MITAGRGAGLETPKGARPRHLAGGDALRDVASGDALHLGGLRALLALGHLELHPLVVVQAAVTRTCDFAVVDEQVAAAVIRGDEAVALFAVEPLDRALRHAYSTENPPRRSRPSSRRVLPGRCEGP